MDSLSKLFETLLFKKHLRSVINYIKEYYAKMVLITSVI